jgi:hypothetical protein
MSIHNKEAAKLSGSSSSAVDTIYAIFFTFSSRGILLVFGFFFRSLSKQVPSQHFPAVKKAFDSHLAHCPSVS